MTRGTLTGAYTRGTMAFTGILALRAKAEAGMGTPMRRPWGVAVVCTLFLPALGYSTAAVARTPYDGPWTVTMRTTRGDCSASFFFGVNVINGTVSQSGGGFTLVGRVSQRGAVRAVIGSGDQVAHASGQLARARGGGGWVSPGRGCAGRWSAVRN